MRPTSNAALSGVNYSFLRRRILQQTIFPLPSAASSRDNFNLSAPVTFQLRSSELRHKKLRLSTFYNSTISEKLHLHCLVVTHLCTLLPRTCSHNMATWPPGLHLYLKEHTELGVSLLRPCYKNKIGPLLCKDLRCQVISDISAKKITSILPFKVWTLACAFSEYSEWWYSSM